MDAMHLFFRLNELFLFIVGSHEYGGTVCKADVLVNFIFARGLLAFVVVVVVVVV